MSDVGADATMTLTMEAVDDASGVIDSVMTSVDSMREVAGAAGIAMTTAFVTSAESLQHYGLQVQRVSVLSGESAAGASRLIAGFVGQGLSADAASGTIRMLEMRLGAMTVQQEKATAAHKQSHTALDVLGVSLKDAAGNARPLEAIIPDLIDKLKGIPDPAERARLASQLFGRNWAQLAPMLAVGGAAFTTAAAEAEKFGLVLTQQDVEAAHAAEVAHNHLSESLQGVGIMLGRVSMPILTNFQEQLANAIAWVRTANPALVDLVGRIAAFGSVFGVLLGGLPVLANVAQVLGTALPGIGQKIEGLIGIFGRFLGPVALIVAVLLALKLAYDNIAAVHVILEPLVNRLNATWQAGLAAWNASHNAITTVGAALTAAGVPAATVVQITTTLNTIVRDLATGFQTLGTAIDAGVAAWKDTGNSAVGLSVALDKMGVPLQTSVSLANNLATALGFIVGHLDLAVPILAGVTAGYIAWNVQLAINAALTGGPGLIAFLIRMIAVAVAMGPVVALTAAWTAAQGALDVALTANPIGLVIVAIGILVGLIVLLIMHWNQVKAVVIDFAGQLSHLIERHDRMTMVILALLGPIGALIAVIALVITHWNQVHAVITQVWNAMQSFWGWLSGAPAAWTNLMAAIGAFFNALGTGASTTLHQVVAAFTGFFAAVIGGVGAFFSRLGATASAAWAEFSAHPIYWIAFLIVYIPARLAVLLAHFVIWVTSMVVQAALWVANMIAHATQLGVRFVETIISFLQALPGRILSILGDVLSGVAGWVGSMISQAVNAGSQFVSAVGREISALPGQVGGFLGSVISAAVSFASSFPSSAHSAAGDFAAALRNGLAALPGEMVSVGADIASGIANGISGALGAIAGAAAEAGRAAIAAAKAAILGGSPSRLAFEEVGLPIAQGIALGITHGTTLATDAVQGLVGSLFGATPGIGASPSLALAGGAGTGAAIAAGFGGAGNSGGTGTMEIVLKIDSQELTRVVLQQAGDRWRLMGGNRGTGA